MGSMSRSRWARARHLLGGLAVASVLVAGAACGSKKAPSTTPPDNSGTPSATNDCGVAEGAAMTTDQCGCLGGSVRTDPGDGSVRCDDGQTNLGRVSMGIEGALCCAAPSNAAQGTPGTQGGGW